MVYDLIVIGAGPAGITASIYAVRKGLRILVVTKDIGGQAAISGDVENYTGYQFISGPELAAKFEEHLHKFNINLQESEAVVSINKAQDGLFGVKTERDNYISKTIIIASGKRSRELKVPGEKEFRNKGLTYCATCDGPLFRGKIVSIIGGGNSALDAALQLINIAQHVYIINNTSNLGGDVVMRQKVVSAKNVTILNNAQVSAILGDKLVNGIRIKKDNKEEDVAVEGVFVEIGLIPNSEFAGLVEKNELGEIKIDSYNRTNIHGVFAAGDVTDVLEKQIIIAAGEGSKAALSAFRYLAEKE